MKKITFDQLPDAVASLDEKLTRIEDLISERLIVSITNDSPDRWFNVEELCEYLPTHPAKQTIYGKVSNRTIPFHKNGKRLSFLKSEIDEWLMSDKQKCIQELEAEAMEYANASSKKRRSA
ncbi:MAG: helix-turn-helix domain-containing protein [Rikenellaceae bacterium]